ncbi:hypothetical protein, partial [Microbacterium arabinogalactanolyticum]|uniref:hypothetical protein n=1 Tax=Microbacterium arabinogalactanolyticum TaxID=69365 RepID=UPI0031DC71EB
VIPASVSIVVACGTVVWTVRSNRLLEKKKTLIVKKEELYGALISFNKSIVLYLTSIKNSSDRTLEKFEKADVLRDESFGKIEIICNMYFPEINLASFKEHAIFFEVKFVSKIRPTSKYTKDSPLYKETYFHDAADNAYTNLFLAINVVKSEVKKIEIF